MGYNIIIRQKQQKWFPTLNTVPKNQLAQVLKDANTVVSNTSTSSWMAKKKKQIQ